MKFKQFLFAALLAAFAGLTVVGCNENDPNEPDPDTVAPATNVEAVVLNATDIGLRWTASSTANATYEVSATDPTGAAAGTVTVTGTTATVTGLMDGTIYTFSVVAVVGTDKSDAATVVWSPAVRLVSDSKVTGALRIYSKAVVGKGSGIVIDQSGAYNASVAGTPANNPDLSKIKLIADLDLTGSTIRIGAPASFTDFNNVANFRTDVQISDATVPATGLDTWFSSASFEGMFAGANTGNFMLQDAQTGGSGVGFVVRWGAPGTYRYARVYVVPGSTGNLIQMDSNQDEYVEIQISYQGFDDVPYAK